MDDITTEAILACGGTGTTGLTTIFQKAWTERKVPEDWPRAVMVPIWKERAARKTVARTEVYPSLATWARCKQRSLNSVHGTRWNLYWVRRRWASEKEEGALTLSSLSDN